jgi:hypothetical protein
MLRLLQLRLSLLLLLIELLEMLLLLQLSVVELLYTRELVRTSLTNSQGTGGVLAARGRRRQPCSTAPALLPDRRRPEGQRQRERERETVSHRDGAPREARTRTDDCCWAGAAGSKKGDE